MKAHFKHLKAKFLNDNVTKSHSKLQNILRHKQNILKSIFKRHAFFLN